jgi:predicted MFS family arabinose efflux permease
VTPRARSVVAFGAFGVWWGAWGALLPEVQRSARVDDGELGAALLLVGAGALASMRITGWMVDRFGGIVLPLSVALLGFAGIGPAFVAGVLPLAATMVVLGATSGAYDVAVNAESSRLESTGGRPLLSLSHAGFSFGVILGSLGAGGLRAAGASLAGVLVGLSVVLAGVAGSLLVGGVRRPDGYQHGAGAWRWWRPPLALGVLGVLLAFAFLVESAWQTWSAVHLERDLGTGPALSSVGPAVFGASAGVGRLLVHRRSGSGREGRLVALGAAVAAAGSVAAALLPVTWLVLVAIAAVGLGTAAGAPLLLSMAGRAVPPSQAGAAVGTVTTVGYLGFVVAPAAVGGLAGATTLPIALAAVAGVAVALAGGTLRLGRQVPAASLDKH